MTVPVLRELVGLDHTDTRLIGALLPDALTEVGAPVPGAAELLRGSPRSCNSWSTVRSMSEPSANKPSDFVSWHYGRLDEIWHGPLADLHVLVDE